VQNKKDGKNDLSRVINSKKTQNN